MYSPVMQAGQGQMGGLVAQLYAFNTYFIPYFQDLGSPLFKAKGVLTMFYFIVSQKWGGQQFLLNFLDHLALILEQMLSRGSQKRMSVVLRQKTF